MSLSPHPTRRLTPHFSSQGKAKCRRQWGPLETPPSLTTMGLSLCTWGTWHMLSTKVLAVAPCSRWTRRAVSMSPAAAAGSSPGVSSAGTPLRLGAGGTPDRKGSQPGSNGRPTGARSFILPRVPGGAWLRWGPRAEGRARQTPESPSHPPVRNTLALLPGRLGPWPTGASLTTLPARCPFPMSTRCEGRPQGESQGGPMNAW